MGVHVRLGVVHQSLQLLTNAPLRRRFRARSSPGRSGRVRPIDEHRPRLTSRRHRRGLAAPRCVEGDAAGGGPPRSAGAPRIRHWKPVPEVVSKGSLMVFSARSSTTAARSRSVASTASRCWCRAVSTAEASADLQLQSLDGDECGMVVSGHGGQRAARRRRSGVGAREGCNAVASAMAGRPAVAVLTGLAVNAETGLGEGEDHVRGRPAGGTRESGGSWRRSSKAGRRRRGDSRTGPAPGRRPAFSASGSGSSRPSAVRRGRHRCALHEPDVPRVALLERRSGRARARRGWARSLGRVRRRWWPVARTAARSSRRRTVARLPATAGHPAVAGQDTGGPFAGEGSVQRRGGAGARRSHRGRGARRRAAWSWSSRGVSGEAATPTGSVRREPASPSVSQTFVCDTY